MSDHDRDDTIAVLTKRYADARQAREAHVRTIATFRAKLARIRSHTCKPSKGLFPLANRFPECHRITQRVGRSRPPSTSYVPVCDEVALTEQLLKEAGVRDPEGSSSSVTLPMNGFVRVQRS